MKAVIQAGGRGVRLRPYTSVLPKPLMPIGARPVVELLLKWLRRNGIKDVYITTGYLGHLIRSFCGDGTQWGININYVHELEPLGTVGALALMRDKLESTFLVLNGDILTDLSLKAFTTYHRKNGGPLTIAAAARTIDMDYGVIDDVDGRITQFREKPKVPVCVSMGAYCMEPEVLQHIPSGTPFGFDDLVFCMMENGFPLHIFKHTGLWLDIGRIEDFQRAQEINNWDEQSPPLEAVAR